MRYISVTVFHLCVPSSGQSSLCDRCIFHDFEQYSCLCIFYNNINSCPEQDPSISVQNDFYSSSLTVTNMVLGGFYNYLSQLQFILHSFQTINTSKGKCQHQNLPVFNSHTWELSRNQLEIEISQTLQFLSPNQSEHQLRKSMKRNGSYIPVGVMKRRLIWSRPLFLL